MCGGIFIGGQSDLQVWDCIGSLPCQQEGVAERGLSGKERGVEPGGRLEIWDSLLGLIDIEQAGAAQELQIAGSGPALDQLDEKSARSREVAAAVKGPR